MTTDRPHIPGGDGATGPGSPVDTPCSCCRSVVGRRPAVAVYRWWTHQGRYSNLLCESCTAYWLIEAATGGLWLLIEVIRPDLLAD
jgi:hypothetical protein